MTVSAFVLDPPNVGETRTYWQGSSEAAVVEVRDSELPGIRIYTEDLRTPREKQSRSGSPGYPAADRR